jgi:hypothetical protein
MNNYIRIKYLLAFIILLCNISCNGKTSIRTVKSYRTFKLTGSDNITVNGVLYRELREGRSIYLKKSNFLNSNEIEFLKNAINKIIPSEKLLITPIEINELGIGLFKIDIVDINSDSLVKYLNIDYSVSKKVQTLAFPFVKLENSIKINFCGSCENEIISNIEQDIAKLNLELGDFSSEKKNKILIMYKKGMSMYTGGRLSH